MHSSFDSTIRFGVIGVGSRRASSEESSPRLAGAKEEEADTVLGWTELGPNEYSFVCVPRGSTGTPCVWMTRGELERVGERAGRGEMSLCREEERCMAESGACGSTATSTSREREGSRVRERVCDRRGWEEPRDELRLITLQRERC